MSLYSQAINSAAGDRLLDYSDYPSVRDHWYSRILFSVSNAFPVENERYILSLDKLGFDKDTDVGPDAEKQAVLTGGSLHRKLQGEYVLTDKTTGEVVDRSRKTLMTIPVLTSRGEVVRNGVRYAIPRQFRVRPGIYTRRADNGMLETNVNIRPGTGHNFQVELDPDKNTFYYKLGGRRIPLVYLLKNMGVPEDEIKAVMGKALYDINSSIRPSPQAVGWIKKFEEKTSAESAEEISPAIVQHFQAMELDPRTTQRTMGTEHPNVTRRTFLDIVHKLLDVHHGGDTDDRDSLAYQSVHDFGDMVGEKISRDQNRVLRNALWKATHTGSLKHVPSGLLNKHLDHFFNQSGIPQAIEEINLLDAYHQNQRVVKIGEGGIRTVQQAPVESRGVQPSYIGFVDPVKSPECYDRDTEVYTESGWKKWPEVDYGDSLACLIDGRLEYHHPQKLIQYDYDGIMYTGKSAVLEYMVTPEHRMYVKKEQASNYCFESPETVSSHKRKFMSGGFQPLVGYLDNFCLPKVHAERENTQDYGKPPIGASLKNIKSPIPISDWAEFMGWFLSEGSCIYRTLPSNSPIYNIYISQSKRANPENYKSIQNLLDRLPFKYHQTGDKGFVICSKQLAKYCHQFGYCSDKYIPEEIFKAPVHAREKFIAAALHGDGRRDRYGRLTAYCTTSSRLAEDFSRLLFTLGRSSRIYFEPDNREERYLGCYIVSIHNRQEKELVHRSKYHPKGLYGTCQYTGKVYCAQVPGGLLYVRRNNMTGFWCGNSLRVGLDMYFAQNTRQGKDDGLLYTQFINKDGEREWVSSEKATESAIGFPEFRESHHRYVMAVVNGSKMEYIPREKVDYFVPSGDEMFSAASNFVPLKMGVKGMRLLMGSKYASQALPLVDAEAPLVDTLMTDSDGRSYNLSEMLGKYGGIVTSPVDGTVEAVYKDKIKVRGVDGEAYIQPLYNNLPLSRKTVIDSVVRVEAGDKVQKGGLLASSNFTDPSGNIAPGRNLSVAYMNYRGYPFDDAVVISESAAKKLSHVALQQESMDKHPDIEHNLQKFQTLFPSRFTDRQAKTLDGKGVVKPGTRVQNGDPLVIGVRTRVPELSSLGRRMTLPEEIIWEHDAPGIVTDIAETDKGYKVFVRTDEPMRENDKLVIRQGGKGVTAKIVSDEDMVKDSSGNPIDVIISRLTIPSRTNDAQVVEAQLGKVARKTGRRYSLPGFLEGDMMKFAKEELRKHNLKDTETVYDPISGKEIPGIMTGVMYMMKTQQTAESKGKARSTDFYTAEGAPGRGGKHGSKHLGAMEMQALLGHQAHETIKDSKLVRGQANDEFWRDVKAGRTPTVPETPFVYEKMKDMIRAAGVNYSENDDHDSIFAMTDKDVQKLTATRKLENSSTFSKDTLTGLPGGLFDPELTDSQGRGRRWTYFETPEPILNPVMQEPVQKILGMTSNELLKYISGEETYGGERGGKALYKKLASIDIDREIEDARKAVVDGPKSSRDGAIKKYRYLKSMKDRNVHPKDFMLTRIPVLPPIFRPIQKLKDMTLVNDMNHMYRDMYNAMQDFQEAERADVPADVVSGARRNMYDTFSSLIGLVDPLRTKLKEKNVGGVLQQLFGKGSGKDSMVSRKVLEANVDMAGMGVIAPDPSLRLNQVGIPVKQGWEVYEPFIIRDMVRSGMPATMAAKEVERQSPRARRSLDKVITERPIIINRAPSLHKYSSLAFWPKLVEGNRMLIPPQSGSVFGADYDGDSVLTSIKIVFEVDAIKDYLNKCNIDNWTLPFSGVYLDCLAKNSAEHNQTLNKESQTMLDENTKVTQVGMSIDLGDFPRLEDTKVEKSETVTEWDVPKGVFVYAYDKDTGEKSRFEVSKFSEHRDVKMLEVTVGSKGMYPETILASEDHSLVVYENGNIVEKCPKDAVGLMTPSLKDTFMVDDSDIVKYLKVGRTVPASYDLGRFIGAIIGDGWVDVANAVYISSDYEEVRDVLMDISNAMLPINSPARHTSNTTRRYGSDIAHKVNFHLTREAAEDLARMIGRGSENKQIPVESLMASKAHLKGLLSGLLSTDGQCIYRESPTRKSPFRGIRYDTISRRLKDGFTDLCRKLGIRTSTSVYTSTSTGGTAYAINVSLVDFKLFMETNPGFSLFNKNKQSILERILESKDTSGMQDAKLDLVPYPIHLHPVLRTLKEAACIPASELCRYKDKGSISRTAAYKLLEASRNIGDMEEAFGEVPGTGFHIWADLVKDEDVTWKKVSSAVEAGRRTCYDITVPGPYTFATGSGLIVQDTMSYTVPTTSAAVKEAVEKLMIDKNLISESSGKPLHVPSQEYLEGLYYMSKQPDTRKPVRFKTSKDMKAAYRKGEISIDTPVVIG